MKFKITVHLNRIPLSYKFMDDFEKARLYNLKHGVEWETTFKKVDINGYISEWLPGKNRWVIKGADTILDLDENADVNMFVFDMGEWANPLGPPLSLKTNTPNGSCRVLPISEKYKPFICVGTYIMDHNNGQTWLQVAHEAMHSYVQDANLKNIETPDVMDSYYMNHLPDFPNGNFAFQWSLLKPYLSFMKNDMISPMKTLVYGDRGEDVKKLQIALGILADGIYGWDTFYAVKSFQKAHSLISDGKAGYQTLKALNLVKPKTLLEAIIQVETGGNDSLVGDIALKNHAYGCLQIRQGVCDDINAKFGTKYISQDCLNNRALSLEIWDKYWKRYPLIVTNEDRSRAWNGGPGWKQRYFKENKTPAEIQYCKNIDSYWKKVSVLL